MAKSLEIYNKCLSDFFLCFGQTMFAAHYEKSFVPAFFKVSIDHLLHIRESGKKLLSGLKS